jgi:hypothetical protein
MYSLNGIDSWAALPMSHSTSVAKSQVFTTRKKEKSNLSLNLTFCYGHSLCLSVFCLNVAYLMMLSVAQISIE